ncbi:hypothetical protein EFN98_02710 [Lactococcus lactis]|nr:hypothetical protein [Lactococcus lactis]
MSSLNEIVPITLESPAPPKAPAPSSQYFPICKIERKNLKIEFYPDCNENVLKVILREVLHV